MTSDESKCVRSEAVELPSRALNTDSLTKFTPGPWFAKPWGDDLSVYVTREDEAEIRVAYVESGYWFLQTDYLLSSDERREKAVAIREANARLIAAAPELYKALAELLSNSGWTNYSDDELRGEADLGNGMAPVLLAARAALAKARGESTPSEGRLSSSSAREAQRSGATEPNQGGDQ